MARKLLGYGLMLVLVFGSAVAIGATAGPTGTSPTPAAHSHGISDAVGPVVNTTGYRIDFGSAAPASLTFRVTGTDGRTVTQFTDTGGGVRLRLTLTGAGTAPARPVYPTMSPDGTWTAQLIPAPGSYRVVADFAPDGGAHTAITTTVHFG